ncbi:MAG: cobalt-precorrin-6A reductase [Geminocystis sp.]|nr:cobalt-precorrin-6A reductase [Geminocystis sp.]HIK36738.1 cobalt-precorrin-6A reductase [Geminocystis sp. M7585_C2015_104]MCS7146818.1 cobalt-precorrin-6A reductase [Geminocystis sp.]MCX8077032.1 cobalt-precorrin-6A reductase [Geminocystis sp.]MDW8115644.1 cobalt-precorrin-6A reductase [Geminocystis sp.]
MRRKKLLLLGGSSEAIELQRRLRQYPQLEVIFSLAGSVSKPRVEASRVGGFGGVEGLVGYIRREAIDLLIDATHPFAANISFNAYTAANTVGIPHLQLVRLPWEKQEGDNWIEVKSHQQAADILPELGNRIFLTIGRQELSKYAHLRQLWFLMRMIESPSPPIPPGEIILARGPFSLQEEIELLKRYQIQVIVSKNSGGDATYAKIVAARQLSLPVVMIKRPTFPPANRVFTVDAAIDWLLNFL